MLAEEQGGRSKNKQEKEGGLAAFIEIYRDPAGWEKPSKHNKATSLQNHLSPNETPYKQTIVSSKNLKHMFPTKKL